MNALTSRTLRASLMLAMAATALGAHAEHKLFPTDVLSAGETDVSASLGRFETKQDNAPHFKVSQDVITLGARLGYGTQTHFGLSVSRADAKITWDNAPEASSDATGVALTVRHALINEGPIKLVLDAGVAHSKGDGPASNAYGAGLSASMQLASGIRPYLSAGVTVPDEDRGAVTWRVEAGGWVAVHPKVTLTPALVLARTSKTHKVESGSSVGLGLSALVQLGQRTYVRPGFSYANGSLGGEDGKETAATISLHHKY